MGRNGHSPHLPASGIGTITAALALHALHLSRR
jgi:hypothetical protein